MLFLPSQRNPARKIDEIIDVLNGKNLRIPKTPETDFQGKIQFPGGSFRIRNLFFLDLRPHTAFFMPFHVGEIGDAEIRPKNLI